MVVVEGCHSSSLARDSCEIVRQIFSSPLDVMTIHIPTTPPSTLETPVEIRVRGCVQGVGFRPTVWQLANRLALVGEVLNDGEGVLIRATGPSERLESLIEQLKRDPPPLAQITDIEIRSGLAPLNRDGFTIADSHPGATRTDIAVDAAICAACTEEILSQHQRRAGYALTNCTHCGPRLSIIRDMPYDRAATTMADFALCECCRAEYQDPGDRRFHAEPIACPACGPRVRLVALDGGPWLAGEDAIETRAESSLEAPIDEAAALIRQGQILAIKGLGGYQLACDATSTEAVERLRRLKRRPTRPLALMVRDLEMIRRYCRLDDLEQQALCSAAAPIVLLERRRDEATGRPLAEALAPGLDRLGVMLPSTPLHVLLCQRLPFPIVMTSGNVSGEPQLIDDDQLGDRLSTIASHALTHDRAIARRIDDSLVQLAAGKVRMLRRARGYAPAPLPLPPGFEDISPGLALGPQQKATFCLVDSQRAILSPHQGDLDDATTLDDYERNLDDFLALYDHRPAWLACDTHPDYRTSAMARRMADDADLPLDAIGHHHAHIAACLADNGYPRDAAPVLGIALDGLGLGEDGSLWGGEFLLADYRHCQRLGSLKSVAMPGAGAASREPWRNLLAQLITGPGLAALTQRHPSLGVLKRLNQKPIDTLTGMIEAGLNSPLASSCGRLFDAVAAALELCFDHQHHEGEAAMALEALAARALKSPQSRSSGAITPYPFALHRTQDGHRILDPAPMWTALFDDLADGKDTPLIAARFHLGLAQGLGEVVGDMLDDALDDNARRLSNTRNVEAVALSGGCFHNRTLLELTLEQLAPLPVRVLTQRQVPANDGGIALGQALIAAARRHPRASDLASDGPTSAISTTSTTSSAPTTATVITATTASNNAQETGHVSGNSRTDHFPR